MLTTPVGLKYNRKLSIVGAAWTLKILSTIVMKFSWLRPLAKSLSKCSFLLRIQQFLNLGDRSPVRRASLIGKKEKIISRISSGRLAVIKWCWSCCLLILFLAGCDSDIARFPLPCACNKSTGTFGCNWENLNGSCNQKGFNACLLSSFCFWFFVSRWENSAFHFRKQLSSTRNKKIVRWQLHFLTTIPGQCEALPAHFKEFQNCFLTKMYVSDKWKRQKSFRVESRFIKRSSMVSITSCFSLLLSLHSSSGLIPRNGDAYQQLSVRKLMNFCFSLCVSSSVQNPNNGFKSEQEADHIRWLHIAVQRDTYRGTFKIHNWLWVQASKWEFTRCELSKSNLGFTRRHRGLQILIKWHNVQQ